MVMMMTWMRMRMLAQLPGRRRALSATRRAICLTALVAAVLTAGGAVGQEDPRSYEVELFTGPLIAPANVVGMSGAFIGIAEGAAGMLFNPAAVANRNHHTGNQWFDWDWAIDWLNVGAGASGADVFRDGYPSPTEGQATLISAALGLMFGRFGVGIQLSGQNLDLCRAADPGAPCSVVTLETQRGGFAIAYNFWDGAFVAGAQLSGAFVKLADAQILEDQALVLGTLWRPHDEPFRVGVVASIPLNDDQVAEENPLGLALPAGLSVPWQLGLGVAYAWGPRRFNAHHTFDDPPAPPDGARLGGAAAQGALSGAPSLSSPVAFAGDALFGPSQDAHRYITASLDVVLIGSVARAMSLRGWINGDVQRAGEEPSISVRAGVESEPWAERLRVRGGTYWEPSRYAGQRGRVHGTTGFDLRAFDWVWRWRLSSAVDVSDDYFNYMISVGFWH
jgi:hypothetical protein